MGAGSPAAASAGRPLGRHDETRANKAGEGGGGRSIAEEAAADKDTRKGGGRRDRAQRTRRSRRSRETSPPRTAPRNEPSCGMAPAHKVVATEEREKRGGGEDLSPPDARPHDSRQTRRRPSQAKAGRRPGGRSRGMRRRLLSMKREGGSRGALAAERAVGRRRPLRMRPACGCPVPCHVLSLQP